MSIRNHLGLTVTILAIVAIVVGWAYTGEMTSAAQPVNPYRVEFTSKLATNTALETLRDAEVDVLYVHYGYTVGGRVSSGEVRVLPDRDRAARISREHDGSVRDRLENLTRMAAGVGPDGRAAFEDQIGTTAASLGALGTGRPAIVGAVVVTTSEGVQRLLQQPAVERVDAMTRASTRTPSRHGLASPSFELPSGYVPDEGWVLINDSSQGGRYVQQTFIWYAGRTLDFGAYPTDPQGYEADFYLSTNNGTYLDPNSTFGIPNVITWNWDYDCTQTYLDSRATDGPESLAYTIGCSDAYHLLTGKWYTTYIRTNNGAANDDRGFVTPQSQHSNNQGPCANTVCFAPTATCLIGGPPGTYPIFAPTLSYHWFLSSGCYSS